MLITLSISFLITLIYSNIFTVASINIWHLTFSEYINVTICNCIPSIIFLLIINTISVFMFGIHPIIADIIGVFPFYMFVSWLERKNAFL